MCKMKIAIDLTPLFNRKWTGIELYAIDLYKALLTTNHEIIPIFNQKNELDNNAKAYIIKRKTKRLLLENYYLSKAVRTIHADITIFPIFPPPIDLYINQKTKIVPVIHDTAFIEYYYTLKFAAKYYLTPKAYISLRKSNFIITISESSKKKLEKYTNLRVVNWGENISKDFLNASKFIDVEDLKQFNLLPYEYYISVSTIEPRKNFKYLLKVIAPLLKKEKSKLVLVGRKGWGDDMELKKRIEELKDYLVFTEYVDIKVLQSLYHYANAFALLSLDEGFGRTPLEAIACGCNKIIVSDIDIFHETLGNSGNYLPLDDESYCISAFLDNQWERVKENFTIPFNVMEEKIKL